MFYNLYQLQTLTAFAIIMQKDGESMEIERKFLINSLPENILSYPAHTIEQAYLCLEPVVRIRRCDDEYTLTYKSKGFLAREEYNLPLNEKSYAHLKAKADGIIITKKRYLIPFSENLTIELDIFEAPYQGLQLAEIEFSTENEALAFMPPHWFGEEVTYSAAYQNSTLGQIS